MTDTLIQRLSDEAGLCRNDGATDIAKLIDDAVYALVNQAAQIDALRADAERYRWLRRTTNAVTSKGDRIDVRNNPELWDSAIDAALRQEQPTKGEGA